MTRRLFLALMAGSIMMAGCLGKPSTVESSEPGSLLVPGWLDGALEFDHEHAKSELHAAGTPNLMHAAHLQWDAILPAGLYPKDAYGEVDVVGETAFVAGLWSGFAIVDIKDPSQPKTLSWTMTLPQYVADIKAAEGGNLALLGIQSSFVTGARQISPVPIAPPPSVATPVNPYPGLRGILAYDTTDKASPKPAGYVWVDRGCHMLSVLAVGTQTYVFCAPGDDAIEVFRLLRPGGAVAFEPVATWSPDDLVGRVNYKLRSPPGQFTHDMTVQIDPLTRKPVMFVSFWDLGVYAVDVADPRKPVTLGRWAGEGSTYFDGNTHTTMAALINGVRVIVAIPEYANPPAMFVLDASDYGSLRLLAEWTYDPEKVYSDTERVLFSMHNFQIVDGKVYLAMYHGGIWVFDINDPAKPTPVGFTLPTPTSAMPGGPLTWDVVVANGHVFALDIPTGLHVYHLEGDPAGEPTYDSFA